MERNRPRPTGRLRWAVENASPAAALRSKTLRPLGLACSAAIAPSARANARGRRMRRGRRMGDTAS